MSDDLRDDIQLVKWLDTSIRSCYTISRSAPHLFLSQKFQHIAYSIVQLEAFKYNRLFIDILVWNF